MDYGRPVQAVIPGVQGKVLSALASTYAELSMRQVASLAGVSQTQASEVLGSLVELGIVERRDVGRSALVRLDRTNAAAELVEQLAGLRAAVLAKMSDASKAIHPAPLALIVFGSFARGEADTASDVDVLAVRRAGVEPDDESWTQTLGGWADAMTHVAGNRVNLLDIEIGDLRPKLRLGARLWREIVTDGVVLAGTAPADLVLHRPRALHPPPTRRSRPSQPDRT